MPTTTATQLLKGNELVVSHDSGCLPRIRSRTPNLNVLALAAMLPVFIGCSGGGVAPVPLDLLLGPEDFPGLLVTVAGGSSTDAEPAVHVELTGPGFQVLESIVVFETRDLALEMLAGIKWDMAALGTESRAVPDFQDISGIDENSSLAGGPASTVLFVEGTALVRLTVAGVDWQPRIMELAETARDKARRP